jgi:hypothetical protein
MHENKSFFFFDNLVFLIPDLYFYDIKIQTNLSLNDVEGKSQIKLKKYIDIKKNKKKTQKGLGWTCIGPTTRLDSAQPRGLG